MKRPRSQYTVRALSEHLHRSRSTTLRLIREAGIELTHVELHYSDDRHERGLRTRRNWRPLTPQEADTVIRYVRAKQGAAAERAAKPPRT